MTRVLVLDHIHEAGLSLLQDRSDLDLVHLPDPGPEAIAEAMARAEILLLRGRHLEPSAWRNSPRLRMISRHGVGCDNLSLDCLARREVTVAVTRGANAGSVAEHAMMLMLAAARGLVDSDAAVRKGDFGRREAQRAVELGGRSLLIVGLGLIGREVARRALAFEMRVSGYDPALPDTTAPPEVERVRDLDRALGEADVVSLHLPRTEESRNLFDAARLARMRRSAILVNAARGGIVDEAALATALREGHLAAAGLDVFAREPLPADDPILSVPNLVVTPHDAALTQEGARRMAVQSATNILDFIDGRLDPDMRVTASATTK